jgi:hypothetical protein
MSTDSSPPARRDFPAGSAATGLLCETLQAPANDNVSRTRRIEIPEDVLADLRRRERR